MPSPFPGVDPYLEGQIWEEFHSLLIAELHRMLVPRLRPRYVARMERRVYLEHTPEEPERLIILDLSVVQVGPVLGTSGSAAVADPPYTIPVYLPEERRESYLEIRLADSGVVVAVIELLSPTNKRANSDGRREYLRKREDVLGSRAHLIELDLLRGGSRLPMARPLPPADFYLLVNRRNRRPWADVWPFTLREPLPHLRVPLTGDDPDVVLDLQEAFSIVYDQAGYDYSLDYSHGTVPPLTPAEQTWAEELLRSRIQ